MPQQRRIATQQKFDLDQAGCLGNYYPGFWKFWEEFKNSKYEIIDGPQITFVVGKGKYAQSITMPEWKTIIIYKN